jgi:hypothetical protein
MKVLILFSLISVHANATDLVPTELIGVWATDGTEFRGEVLFKGQALYFDTDGIGAIIGGYGGTVIGARIIIKSYSDNTLTYYATENGKIDCEGVSLVYDPARKVLFSSKDSQQRFYRRFNKVSAEIRNSLGLEPKHKVITDQARSCESMEPRKNSSPKDRIEVVGTVPENVAVELETTWETTANVPECMHSVPLVSSFPYRVRVPIQLNPQDGHQFNWIVWRDYFQPGHCGWQLKEILAYADHTDSGLPVSRFSNIPNRVVYVCRDNDNCVNTLSINDDSSKPIYLYCKFSVIRHIPNTEGRKEAVNPCAFERVEHQGTDIGKFEHFLRPDHHRIEFVINDLEAHN